MAQVNLVQRYTDANYSSKKEVSDALGPSYAESVWRLICDYREKYRFPISLKRFDNFPFTVVLTPAIMAHANSAERKMFEYCLIYERYRNCEYVSDEKVLTNYKQDILKADLLALARYADMEISERDIDLMLEVNSTHLKNSSIYGYSQALNYLLNEGAKQTINSQLLRDLNNKISHIGDKILRYRDHESFDIDNSIDPKQILGAPTNRIIEFMDQLFAFYDADFELSPFIIGAIMYAYILYVLPFTNNSEYVAILTFQKVLHEKGYGEASYFMSLTQSLVKKNDKLKEAYENSRLSGDLTYIIIFLCDVVKETLNWKIANIQTLDLPKPVRDEVKVVEKIVEIPVEKRVEVVKEVIKEVKVPVEKIVYVETQKANDIAKEAAALKAREEDYKDREQIIKENIKKEEPVNKKEGPYDFIKDPFATPVASFDVLEPKKVEEPKEEIKKEEPKEILIPKEELNATVKPASISSNDMRPAVAKLWNLSEEEMAKGLVEINPMLRYHQALFYAKHHDLGRYYTISQFKEDADCAYETARTSMEFLVSLCLYRKEQLKNKFVYTPTEIIVSEDK